MVRWFIFASLLACQLYTYAQPVTQGNAVSERDFLDEMPVVLSVSRLAQRLDDIPGAVTILDREFIRMSGARDVADLLRLVPGFQTTTTFETDEPFVSYHGRSDEFSNRLQVLVDGRPVYSGYLMGSTGLGLQTLAMTDIERIEVLRGSNSAAYGSRAFLGVVNIISRDVRDTVGASAGLTTGQNGVADANASLGWQGDRGAVYRMSVDSRGDDGLRGAYGANRINRVHFSVLLPMAVGNELELRAGGIDVLANRGNPDPTAYGAAARTTYRGTRFVQGDWNLNLGPDQDLKLMASHTESTVRDSFPYLNPAPGYAPYFGISINYNGVERIDLLSLQYTTRPATDLRVVMGAETQWESIYSPSQFDARGHVDNAFYRVFGNAEWRVAPRWVLNLGAMAEHSDQSGATLAPRVMLNWHPADDHTLRAGFSNAYRPPSAYENYAYVRYFDTNGKNPTPPLVLSSGTVKPERVAASELGYQLNVPSRHLSADVRIFHEHLSDGMVINDAAAADFSNQDDYITRGLEYQLEWRPKVGNRLVFNQAWTEVSGLPYVLPAEKGEDRHGFRVSYGVPRLATNLAWMQNLDGGWKLTLAHSHADGAALMGVHSPSDLEVMRRTDVRVAREFRIGTHKAEVAVTVQSLGGSIQDGARDSYFDRRAMMSLRLEQ
jgi:iron complex outermembrane receptor protein